MTDVNVPTHPGVDKLRGLNQSDHVLVGPLARAQNNVPHLRVRESMFSRDIFPARAYQALDTVA